MNLLQQEIILRWVGTMFAGALVLAFVGCASETGDSDGGGEVDLSPACEAVSQDLETGLVETAEKHGACASEADCVPISFNLTCPDDDTRVEGCPVAYARDQEDAFKAAAMQFIFSLCSSLEAVCISSPDCPNPNTVCVDGTCAIAL
jgi:hypothetical protein